MYKRECYENDIEKGDVLCLDTKEPKNQDCK